MSFIKNKMNNDNKFFRVESFHILKILPIQLISISDNKCSWSRLILRITRKYNLKIDFKPFNQVEGISSKDVTGEKRGACAPNPSK